MPSLSVCLLSCLLSCLSVCVSVCLLCACLPARCVPALPACWLAGCVSLSHCLSVLSVSVCSLCTGDDEEAAARAYDKAAAAAGRLNLNFPNAAQAHAAEYTTKKSRFRGVWWDKKARKWMARIYSRGASQFIGAFDDEVAAAQAYDNARLELNRTARNFPAVGASDDNAGLTTLAVSMAGSAASASLDDDDFTSDDEAPIPHAGAVPLHLHLRLCLVSFFVSFFAFSCLSLFPFFADVLEYIRTFVQMTLTISLTISPTMKSLPGQSATATQRATETQLW